MTIVALLLGTLMYTLSAQSEQRSREDTLRRLEDAKELLISFAIVNGRLPCPAAAPPQSPYNNAAGTGVESVAAGVCTDSYTGFLPGRTIGFQPLDAAGYALDAWRNPIRYAVSSVGPNGHFTTALSLKTNGITTVPNDLVICTTSTGIQTVPPSCNLAAPVTNQGVVAAVLWSQGKNFITTGVGGNDELANNKHRLPAVVNNNAVFVWHEPRPTGGLNGEYDDLMIWLPVGAFYGRLISAGVLP
jgi:type II secretory pathway pseudopilin PulG